MGARQQEDDDERIRKEVEQLHDGREAPDGSRIIRAVRGEAPCGLAGAQSLFGRRHALVDRWPGCSNLYVGSRPFRGPSRNGDGNGGW